MNYEAVLEKVRTVPEEYLGEVSMLIDDFIEQHKKNGVSNENFVFDSLVHHTDRADFADEYIRNLRDNDRF